MLCRICLKKVRTRRHWNHLFHPEIHHICESCYGKYPLLSRFEVIPVEGYVMRYHVMSTKNTHLDPISYMSFDHQYIRMFLKHHDNDIVLLFDTMDSQVLSLLDSLKLGNLFVVTLYENI